ncbi:GNAT family N-acetyltransferase [Nocardia mexicana]|uniref:Acetyltransferase (GNAT) family protein n=1 Tax=Nocardia mexicana TaxID=279262 RepID=A0A370GRX8_9NOCA|nr:GNAT family N-acetyltransferase [Nocardia mexicana]RDI44693.1 acetyltransferase (GNAT) family protein [Nocardia mexicana]
MEKVVTYLELTRPGALVAAPVVAGVGLRRVDRESPLVRSVQAGVGEPYGWGAARRSAERWSAYLAEHPDEQYWLITVENEPAGVAYLEPQPAGDVEVTAFGLLPAYVGKGFGAYALTLALRQAWATEPVGAQEVRRVWLHTCSLDHPNALGNYRKRGLRPYRVETKPVDQS